MKRKSDRNEYAAEENKTEAYGCRKNKENFNGSAPTTEGSYWI